HLAVRLDRPEAVERGSAGADDELAHAFRGVKCATRVHRREALVLVIVAAEYDLDSAVVGVRPERLLARVVAVLGARGEARLVPVDERAHVRVRGEVAAEPRLLGRTGRRGDLAVE